MSTSNLSNKTPAAARPMVLPEFNPEMLRRLPDPGARAKLVDKWILARIAQAQTITQQLEKRLTLLNKADAGVQSMISSLRERLAEVSPAISKLDDAGQRIEAQARDALHHVQSNIEPVEEHIQNLAKQVKGQIQDMVRQDVPAEVGPMLDDFKSQLHGSVESATQTIEHRLSAARTEAERSGVEVAEQVQKELTALCEKVKLTLSPLESDAHRHLSEQIESHRQHVTSIIQSAATSTWEEAQRVTRKIVQQAEQSATQLEQRVSALEHRAQVVGAELEQALEGAQERAHAIAGSIDDAVATTLSSLERRMSTLFEPVHQTIESRMVDFKQRLTDDLTAAEGYLNERLVEAQAALVGQARQFESLVSDSLVDFQGSASQVLSGAREQLTTFTTELMSASEQVALPALEKLARTRAQTEVQLEEASKALQQVARERALELERAGEIAVDAVDRAIEQKLEALRPRATEVFHGTVSRFRADTSELVEQTLQCLEQGQTALSQRLGATRDAQQQIVQEIEQSMRGSLTQLEQHAVDLTRVLEQRLSRRVSEVVQINRKALRDAISGVTTDDDAPFSEMVTDVGAVSAEDAPDLA